MRRCWASGRVFYPRRQQVRQERCGRRCPFQRTGQRRQRARLRARQRRPLLRAGGSCRLGRQWLHGRVSLCARLHGREWRRQHWLESCTQAGGLPPACAAQHKRPTRLGGGMPPAAAQAPQAPTHMPPARKPSWRQPHLSICINIMPIYLGRASGLSGKQAAIRLKQNSPWLSSEQTSPGKPPG